MKSINLTEMYINFVYSNIDCSVNEFYDFCKIPLEQRTDFLLACILCQAHEIIRGNQ